MLVSKAWNERENAEGAGGEGMCRQGLLTYT